MPGPIRWPAWFGDLTPVAYGADYYPEQWPEEVWADDMALMAQAGVNLVTVGVFAWAKLQPTPDSWDFGWLDRVLDLLAEHRIAVDLATATASTPPWFTTRHPHSALVTAQGVRLTHGSRQVWCPSSPAYRRASLELVERLAARYGDHPGLALWHVSNELGCHNAVCYCDQSATSFRAWLKLRYGTLDNLNWAWGTDFWSQRYGAWEEILPPRATSSFGNPTHQLDYMRFSSDELRGQLAAEAGLLRRLTPEMPVMTNLMLPSAWGDLDYARWVDLVDVVANDHYTDSADPRRHVGLALAADASRGLAAGQPWLLVEHSTSAVNWQPINRAKGPGELRRDSLVHLARGADSVLFFQWRASQAGAERHHSAMVPHAGPDSELFRQVQALGADLARLAPLVGSQTVAPIGLVVDQPSWAASRLDCLPSHRLDFEAGLRAWYEALWDAHLTCDVIPSSAAFDRYRLLIVPHWSLMDLVQAERLRDYVEAGGHLVVTFFSGVADASQRVHLGGYPGALRDLLGVRVEEFRPLLDGERVQLSDGAVGTIWTEPVQAVDATVLARYLDGPSASYPAVTRAERGRGLAWYVSTQLDSAGLGELVDRVAEQAQVPRIDAPADVEIVIRRGPTAQYTFVINHSTEDVGLRFNGVDLLTGDRGPVIVAPAGAVRVVEQPLG
ncbi:MAG: beta-galactosidase [Propionibacteriaceae bacterium]|jgi:beta-galactosidase|nr:beta-galactosidase [Propionibacteriaceae bacterium]